MHISKYISTNICLCVCVCVYAFVNFEKIEHYPPPGSHRDCSKKVESKDHSSLDYFQLKQGISGAKLVIVLL